LLCQAILDGAGIKHKKGLIDVKRGKVFTKIIREITIAAKLSGGHPESNLVCARRWKMRVKRTCRMTILKKAVQRGTGELPGVNLRRVGL